MLTRVLFRSLAVLDPRVGHTMDALSPFTSLLCRSDWLFHGESCPRLDALVVYTAHSCKASIASTMRAPRGPSHNWGPWMCVPFGDWWLHQWAPRGRYYWLCTGPMRDGYLGNALCRRQKVVYGKEFWASHRKGLTTEHGTPVSRYEQSMAASGPQMLATYLQQIEHFAILAGQQAD